jgi:hypothetical protein
MIARFLGTTIVVLMILTVYVYFHYADTRLTVPEEKIGRIYPLNVHGRVIYLVKRGATGTICLEGRDSELHSEFRACCPTKAEAAIGRNRISPAADNPTTTTGQDLISKK